MNRLSGFIVGFMIALTAVLTMIQSMSQRSPTERPSIAAAGNHAASVMVMSKTDSVASRNGNMSSTGATTNQDSSDVTSAGSIEPLTEAEASLENTPTAPSSAAAPTANEQSPTQAVVAATTTLSVPIETIPAAADTPVSQPLVAMQEQIRGAGAPDQLDATPNADNNGMRDSDATVENEADKPQWYAFWQPFSSEISARGFRTRLERITRLDYRVVKVESGQYHVAFSYNDEQSRARHLATIEQATGLSLGGESF